MAAAPDLACERSGNAEPINSDFHGYSPRFHRFNRLITVTVPGVAHPSLSGRAGRSGRAPKESARGSDTFGSRRVGAQDPLQVACSCKCDLDLGLSLATGLAVNGPASAAPWPRSYSPQAFHFGPAERPGVPTVRSVERRRLRPGDLQSLSTCSRKAQGGQPHRQARARERSEGGRAMPAAGAALAVRPGPGVRARNRFPRRAAANPRESRSIRSRAVRDHDEVPQVSSSIDTSQACVRSKRCIGRCRRATI